MIDLAGGIWHVMGMQQPLKVKYTEGFKFDIRRRVPNVEKAKKLIGWKPKVKFENGLKEVIAWLQKQKNQGKFKAGR